jgi:hypothetical protein
MVLATAEGQTIPEAVLDAALALHKQKNTGLAFAPFSHAGATTAESNALWHIADGEVRFASLEARNQCVALATFRQLMPLSSTDALFDSAYDLWRNEIGHADTASGRLLALAGQSVKILLEAAKIIRNKERRVFDVLHLVEKALPHLSNLRAEDIAVVVEAQHESTKHDLAGGLIFNAIENRLRSEPALAWEAAHFTKNNMTDSMQALYSTALQALMYTDQQALSLEKARQDARDSDSRVAGPALWTLGRAIQIHELNSGEMDNCVAVLVGKTSAATTEIQQAAIRAVAHASLKDERLMSELVRLATAGGDYALAVVANFLFLNQRDLPVSSPQFEPLLKSLIGLSPSQKGAIENFDWVLHQLYETPAHRSLVLDCLTHWLVLHGSPHLNDKDSIELFDQTIKQIANDQPHFQAIITRWLVAPEKQLAVAVGGLISFMHIRGMKSPVFSPEVLNTFAPEDFRLLVRRLLGYVIFEEPLLSLTFSLMDTHNPAQRSFPWVYSLLTNEVGRDYAHATIKALSERQLTATSPEKDLFGQIQAILLQRRAALDGVSRLQELRPPLKLRRAITLNRAREMEKARELADEKSIIRSIATVIPMKAGRGWFSVSNNQVGPTQQLQSISHSIALPTRSITDPIGYAIAGIYFRIAKRGDE